jgi:hypothetical protein
MPRVGAVGLGAPPATPQAGGVGRFGQMRNQPRPLEPLDDEPPTRARLHRERGVTGRQRRQP